MYNLSSYTFQIMPLITQDLWIVQIIAFLEFVNRVVKTKIDFLKCLKIRNIIQHKHFASTASLLETKYFTIHIIVCNLKLKKC